jgi:pimeloyl-ACP methyl ester carboxylesterase
MSRADPPQVPGVTHRYVDAGGLRVHLADAGEGDPVLLLHGWPQHHFMWRHLIERLAPSYRLLAPDLRGFGWTEAPGDGYDGETFARDQVALLDALELDRVRVIGHDWGGWTTFLLGLRHPERVERLVVCNAPHPWPRIGLQTLGQTPRSWYAAINATPGLGPLVHRRPAMPRAILRHGAPRGTYSEAEIATYADSYRDPARARAMSRLYRYYHRVLVQLARGAFRDSRLVAPSLLLFGERDRLVSQRLLAGDLGDRAEDLRIELVPDAGHFLVDEKPDLVGERAVSFFGEGPVR